jgi:hypothetical protein
MYILKNKRNIAKIQYLFNIFLTNSGTNRFFVRSKNYLGKQGRYRNAGIRKAAL